MPNAQPDLWLIWNLALIRIDDGSLIRYELPRAAAKLVEQWREPHVAALTRNWDRAQPGVNPSRWAEVQLDEHARQ